MSNRNCWCGGEAYEIRKPYHRETSLACAESQYHDPVATGGTPPEKVRKLYIAGPMSGLPDSNYPAFNHSAETLRQAGFGVENPADSTLSAAHYVDFLRQDLKDMLDCQGVATLSGWEFSTGARNEVQVAGLLRMPVRPVSWWLELRASLDPLNEEDKRKRVIVGEVSREQNDLTWDPVRGRWEFNRPRFNNLHFRSLLDAKRHGWSVEFSDEAVVLPNRP